MPCYGPKDFRYYCLDQSFAIFKERFLNDAPSAYQYSISFEHDHRLSIFRKRKIRAVFRLEMLSQLPWKNDSGESSLGRLDDMCVESNVLSMHEWLFEERK